MSWVVRLLVPVGLVATIAYFDWWILVVTHGSPLFVILVVPGAVYSVTQLMSSWLLYLLPERKSNPRPPDPRLSVDVFLPVLNEDPEVVERTLAAAIAMRGRHTVWLLDDGRDPDMHRLAAKYDAGYLTRPNGANAKAGNINAALARTSGDIVVIFDADHAPTEDFLDRTLGHFSDPDVGLVQVMLTYSNGEATWVARAAEEVSFDFFNPISAGMDRLDSASHHGSNGLIRRRALESIDGYRSGLAEDLATSMALHAAGWKTRYVREPLAPGLLPASLHDWFIQQLKWARGVFEVLVVDYPRVASRLNAWQHLCYALRMTCYFWGPVIAVHLILTVGFLSLTKSSTVLDYSVHMQRALFLGLVTSAIRRAALHSCSPPSWHPLRLMWRGDLLVSATWPIYVWALILTLTRKPVSWTITPKKGNPGPLPIRYLLPHAVTVVIIALALVGAIGRTDPHPALAVAAIFASLQTTPAFYLLLRSFRDGTRRGESQALIG